MQLIKAEMTKAPFLPMDQYEQQGYEAHHVFSESFEVTQFHCHDYFEFYIHIRGGEYMGVDNQLYLLKPNQVFILPPFSMHGLSCTHEMRNYERAYLNLSPKSSASWAAARSTWNSSSVPSRLKASVPTSWPIRMRNSLSPGFRKSVITRQNRTPAMTPSAVFRITP